MAEPSKLLAQRVRPAALAYHLGWLGLVFSVVLLVPLLAALLFGEYAMAWPFVYILVPLLALSLWLRRAAPPEQLQVNEALVLTSAAFILSSLLFSVPMAAAGLNYTDALFEAISSITSTGLTTLATVETLPRTFLFTRAWGQWVGGLGIVVFTLAIIAGHSAASRRLLEPEITPRNLAASTQQHARQMLGVYLLLSLVSLALVMLVLGGRPFEALTLTLASVATGGFTPYDDSLAGLDGISAYVLMLPALATTVALPLYFTAYHDSWRQLGRDPELHLLLLLLLLLVVGLALLLHGEGYSWGEAWRLGGLLALTAQTTTGFEPLDPGTLGEASKLMLIAAMFTGGSLGSTAGGIKLLRLLIVWRVLVLMLRRTSLPIHVVSEAHVGRHRLQAEEVAQALLLVWLFVALVFISWLPFVIAGYPPVDALFEVVSAAATAGLSTGVTAAELPEYLKAVLCLDMLAGRVEILAILVLLYPPNWLARRG